MRGDLLHGNITKGLLLFAWPIMVGNLMQQFYNIADTLIVGRYLGEGALAAVGSAYTLMTFLTSVILGLCMGSGAFFSIYYGKGDTQRMKKGIFLSFVLILAVTLVLEAAVFAGLNPILSLMNVPADVFPLMREYLLFIFIGMPATFLYNYYASVLRSIGNSTVPLVFLAVSAVMNIGLDLFLVLVIPWGVAGAAIATVISQFFSGIGLAVYVWIRFPSLRFERQFMHWDAGILKELSHFSFLTCVQQSVMNFGILMVQGLVNSFGATVMAGFAAAVKIDSFAYMPVQDFGNAFSTFIALNYGAGNQERIRKGTRSAVLASFLFCVVISALVCIFAPQLMGIFVQAEETGVVNVGVQYLRIEGAFYFGIGLLFLLYGYYRAVAKPGMSVVLTVLSLGTRVLLAYVLSAVDAIGVIGIWASVPIGWALADIVGVGWYFWCRRRTKLDRDNSKE
ncbi:MAG TPA: MATE family efflux transporter [Candidatus Onthovicinus excrementipullorum]|nr:MATE family efflux transporter [Candidatus Onthovicinus excrementipullorum]